MSYTGHGTCVECISPFSYKNKRKIPQHCSVRCYNAANNRRYYGEVKYLKEVVNEQTFLIIFLVILNVNKKEKPLLDSE